MASADLLVVRPVSDCEMPLKLKDGSIVYVKIDIRSVNTDNEEQDDQVTLRRGTICDPL